MYKIVEYIDKYNEKINEFVISIYVEEHGFEEHRELIKNDDNSIYSKSGGNLWIAINESGEIVGTIATYKYDYESVELKRLYVRKDFRGTGLARVLYGTALNFCKEKSFKKIFLGTYDRLETAIHFYLKRGFNEIEEKREKSGARFFKLDI